MESQTVMSFLGGKASAYVTAFLGIIDVISVFVSVVLAFLILYANTFLIRRRKKELGTYLLLGLPQGRVAGLLFLETLLIGLLALGDVYKRQTPYRPSRPRCRRHPSGLQ